VSVALPFPGAAMLAALQLALTEVGMPEAEKETGELKPPLERVVRVTTALRPLATVAEVAFAVRVNPGTFTERVVRWVTPPPAAVATIE